MPDETLKFEDNSMQSSLKVTRFQPDRLPVQRKSSLIKGLISIAVILPQALAFAAASGIEAKAELYTAVVIGTVLAAWLISHSLHKSRNLIQNSVKSTILK
jgi:MFS superfamily sulfate permease-like transporter